MSTSTVRATTPMMRQYYEIKDQHEDAILFFRLGDFYEMFESDAVLASRELEITLTGRGKDDNRIPMCGVPYHAAEAYIHKLVNKGYNVAICEQTEVATPGAGISKREVVQVHTPGTLMGNDDDSQTRLLAAVYKPAKGTETGLSVLDMSTGYCATLNCASEDELALAVGRLQVSEWLIPRDAAQTTLVNTGQTPTQTYSPLDPDHAEIELKHFFKINDLRAFDIADWPACFPAIFALIEYAKKMQQHDCAQIRSVVPIRNHHHMIMDDITIRHLELIQSSDPKQANLSLFSTLNFCKNSHRSPPVKTTHYDAIFRRWNHHQATRCRRCHAPRYRSPRRASRAFDSSLRFRASDCKNCFEYEQSSRYGVVATFPKRTKRYGRYLPATEWRNLGIL